MKSNNNGQNGSNNGKFSSDTKQNKLPLEADFTDSFDSEWDRLSPENAKLLTRIKEEFVGTHEWIESANIFLLPFHSFVAGRRLKIRLFRKLSVTTLRILWSVSYFDERCGEVALYEADLLILKRRIYEQGNNLKNCLEIDLGAGLAPFIEKYKKINDLERLFLLNAALGAEIYMNNNQNRNKGNEIKENYLIEAFSRFKGIITRSENNADNSPKEILRVGLDEYWLDWVKIAQRAEFDFDYLSPLKPIEMRFYELTQLLRFRDVQKPVDELKKMSLKIRYSEFSKLMPLPRLKTYNQVEDQINRLCRIHLKMGYLENISIRPIQRKGIFADANLELVLNG
jgi:hypothetical protein